MMNAQYKVDLIKKIDGFAKYIRATVHVSKRMSAGKEQATFTLDNGIIVVQFTMYADIFQIIAYNKLSKEIIQKTQSKLYDLESITYDYETITEVLNVLEYV